MRSPIFDCPEGCQKPFSTSGHFSGREHGMIVALLCITHTGVQCDWPLLLIHITDRVDASSGAFIHADFL